LASNAPLAVSGMKEVLGLLGRDPNFVPGKTN